MAPLPETTTSTTTSTTSVQASPALVAEDVTFTSDGLTLHGYLWKPSGDGPFPAIIYNHGSDENPNRYGAMLRYFYDNGYVVFEPLRRGHGASEGQTETELTNVAATSNRPQAVIDAFNAEVDDVLAGLAYVKALPYVDQNRLAVSGCSYGGIMTVLTAEQPNTGLKVAVDFAGASESWGNKLLQTRLLQAVDSASIPIFFLQAENDYNTSPTTVLSAEMTKLGKANQAKIYPAYGTTAGQGHAGFCTSASAIWGADVLSYIESYTK